MILPSLNTTGQVLIGLALFVAILPLQMPSPGEDPSTLLYRSAKGSMIPAAQAYSDAAGFFQFAALLAITGVCLMAASSALDSRDREARKRDRPTRKP